MNHDPLSGTSISKNEDETSDNKLSPIDDKTPVEESLSPKTSSTRRKLKLPIKNAHSSNKVSPGKRRRSRRSMGIAASKEMEKAVFATTDKENKNSIISNTVVVNDLQDNINVLSNSKNIGRDNKPCRKSTSSLYSPVVKVTPKSKMKLDQQDNQDRTTTNERSILQEIGDKLDRVGTINSPCKVPEVMDKDPLYVSPNEDVSFRSKVMVEKLSPQNEKLSSKSPVKVLNEDPLKLEAVDEKNDPSPVARRINFDPNNIQEDQHKSSESDSQIIESSQLEKLNEINLQNVSEIKSRKRRISNVIGNKPKKAKTNSDQLESENKTDEVIEKIKDTESSNKRSRRIANKIKPKSPEKISKNVESSELAKPEDIETKHSVEKQPSQKMRRNKYGESPLHVAVKRGDIEKVRSLLSDGANANSKDHAGWRPIHESMRDGENALRIIRLLVDYGADINAQSDSGNTALHDAAAYMSHEIIEYLVKSGADPTVKNLDGKSPLDISKLPQYNRSKEIKEVLTVVQESNNRDSEKMDVDATDNDLKPFSVRHDVAISLDEKNDSSNNSPSKATGKTSNSSVSNLVNGIVARGISNSDNKPESESEDSVDLFPVSEKDMSTPSNQETTVSNDNIKEDKSGPINLPESSNVVITDLKSATKEVSHSKNEVGEKSKIVESKISEVTNTTSVSSTISNNESNSLNERMVSQSSESEDEKNADQNSMQKPTLNIRASSTTIASTTKRPERRSNMMSPFGPGSRGARLLEMANKRSKLSNNLSLPPNNDLNNSFSESGSCGESNYETDHGLAADRSLTNPSRLALMSPRVERRASLVSTHPTLSLQQEKVKTE